MNALGPQAGRRDEEVDEGRDDVDDEDEVVAGRFFAGHGQKASGIEAVARVWIDGVFGRDIGRDIPKRLYYYKWVPVTGRG